MNRLTWYYYNIDTQSHFVYKPPIKNRILFLFSKQNLNKSVVIRLVNLVSIMKIAVIGQAKTGTTALFTSVLQGLTGKVDTIFEPRKRQQFNPKNS